MFYILHINTVLFIYSKNCQYRHLYKEDKLVSKDTYIMDSDSGVSVL